MQISEDKRNSSFVAHKFGGSSLADASRIRHVAQLITARDEDRQVIVVSAMKGVTNDLIAITSEAAARSEWRPQFNALKERHLAAARDVSSADTSLTDWLGASFNQVAIELASLGTDAPSRETAEAIIGMGEVWSSRLTDACLHAAGATCSLMDARDVLVVHPGESGSGAIVDWKETERRLTLWKDGEKEACTRIVITGFIASDRTGRATLLGRNGSDYSGAIFAALFNAQELHIWTDVDGVLTADPRLEPEAVMLDAMTYAEASELAYFGAKVLHPKTIAPAVAANIPIFIHNTFRPERPGTRIDAAGAVSGPVKGLTLANDLALINLEGSGTIGVSGTAERAFAALHSANVSVVMVSQGSSEHSICVVVRDVDQDAAMRALQSAFDGELAAGHIHAIHTSADIAVLAAVGEHMAGTPGVAARMFDALARSRINIRAIAQGSSERNISVAINRSDATVALRAVHAAFWLSRQTICVGVIGPGKVGSALLDQISAAAPRLRRTAGLDLRLRAILSTKYLLADERDLGSNWRDRDADFVDNDIDGFMKHLIAAHLPHTVIIDCSASGAVADRYPQWLESGIHVITPNKQAGAGPLQLYRAIRAASDKGGARFRYEATVGAGLPIISTLRDLLDTGDELIAIEGIFSGTLAWLFNRFDGTMRFSALVREARELAYTEPDPRDDLSGTDVARKLVILAREAGRDLSLSDVQVENLVPPSLRDADADEFMDRLEEVDNHMDERLNSARANGCVLRYVARLDAAGAKVGLVELPPDHAFGNIRLTDNVVQFTTKRYRDNPLVIQGPGAGPEVTAAGVFADLLRVAQGIGARL